MQQIGITPVMRTRATNSDAGTDIIRRGNPGGSGRLRFPLPACDVALLDDVADEISQCDDAEAYDKDSGIQRHTPSFSLHV